MKKYVCMVCGYVYDEKEGDPDNGVRSWHKMGGCSGRLDMPDMRSFQRGV